MSVIKPALQHPNLITHLMGANNYCWIYYRNGEKKLLAKPISYLQDELPGFIRIHKSVLINPSYARSLTAPPRQKMAGEIQLESGLVFPVSRRRWSEVAEALEYRLPPGSGTVTLSSSFVVSSSKDTPLEKRPQPSLLLVSTDSSHEAHLAKLMAQNWPHYQVQTIQQSYHLPDFLSRLSADQQPILILMDARTATQERLQTLQHLKQEPTLCRIPVILFVLPTDVLITEGYKRQANSVITLQDGQLSFIQTVDRICRYWLQMAALPYLPGRFRDTRNTRSGTP